MPTAAVSRAAQKGRPTARSGSASHRLPASVSVLWLAVAFVGGLAAFMLLPRVSVHPMLLASFGGASAILLAWLAVLWIGTRTTGRRLRIELSLRPQHYLQALAHASIFVYWGMYWSPLQDAAALIVAQIVFAYAFDMLLAWSRREDYAFGFGPFPIIFSTNLFLRFRDDWFALQFLMIAVGFLAKELIRWEKDGRRTHIFNPSSFALALFSLGLIVTGTSRITWAEEIATLLILPPQIYLFIFLVSLPGQFLFRVTTMTLPAVLTTYVFSVAYMKVTGTYFFFDSNIPIAVFLGMHLLFTDPSTSPRTELGRILFGVFYGASVIALYAALGWIGAPTYYDKLLQVPLMNLLIKRFDRVGSARALAWIDPRRIGAALAPRMRSVAYVSLWIVVFGAMTAAGGVGDRHPGQTVRFWEGACREGRSNGCSNLAIVEARHCSAGSGWACNEVGVLGTTGRAVTAPPEQLFAAACRLGFTAGCANRGLLASGVRPFQHGDPRLQDFPIVLRHGKGAVPERTPVELYTRACHEGWMAGCGALGNAYMQGETGTPDKARALDLWEQACKGGHATSCSNVGLMYNLGDGVARDGVKALAYLKAACDLGLASACRLLTEQGAQPPPPHEVALPST